MSQTTAAPTTRTDTLDALAGHAGSAPGWWIAAALMLTVTLAVVLGVAARAVRRRPAAGDPVRPTRDAAATGRRWLIGVAVIAAVGVAAVGGLRSFEAVSVKFGSPLVPLTADGMIIACTALRLAALTRGWRLPGSVATTYLFIAGTVWLNVAAAHGWTDAVAHALAPVSYAVLVEFLAHFLRLHLRLAQPTRPRVTALTWFTSPVVTTRVWLHMARTGESDPVAARALVQQVVRMSSRLATICPSRPLLGWLPIDHARAARSAALQTIRDGLLGAADLAALLPQDSPRVDAGALLALVDSAALRCTTPNPSSRTDQRTIDRTGERTGREHGAPDAARTSAPDLLHADHTPTGVPSSNGAGRAVRDERSDDELVTVLHRHADAHNDGRPLSQREVMRVLGVGTPKAKRLAVHAGWAEPTTPTGWSGIHRQTNDPGQVPGQLALVTKPTKSTKTHGTAEDSEDEVSETNREEAHARNSR